MELLLLGIGFGLLTVAMPGPVSVSLVQVASLQGRSSGIRAAVGIAGGDVILGASSVGLVSLGAGLPTRAFDLLQVITAGVLLTLGVLLLLRPAVVQDRASTVSRPLRAFLVLTTLMPSALGSWLALLTAMPFASDRSSLLLFAAGVIAVSAIWHPLLGVGAGAIGPRLTQSKLRLGTQIGGIATLGIGIWAIVPLVA